jgi:hypothetical protein
VLCVCCPQLSLQRQTREAVGSFLRGFELASNTRRTYGTHERTFSRICQEYGIGESRPLSEVDLTFVTAVYADTHKVTTVDSFLSAISRLHRDRFPSATFPKDGLGFTAALRGLHNFYGNVVSQPKAPVSLADLTAFSPLLDTRYFEYARGWAACLLAFFGLLRIKEYMCGGLRRRHVVISADRVDIIVPFSKTSNVPVVVSVSARADSLCPVRALSWYLDALLALGAPSDADAPLFTSRFRSPSGVTSYAATSDSEFLTLVRDLIRAAFPDRDPSAYAGHSFRRGGATALLLAGVSDAVVQRHGRWTSDAYRRYFDTASSPAARLVATRALLIPQ